MPRGKRTDPNVPGAAGAAEASAKIGDNSKYVELTPDELRALALNHKRKYEVSLTAKKVADADFKNVCKKAKADGITVDQIKTMIALDTPEGEAKQRADIAATLLAAQWAGSPLGSQLEMFQQPDRTPSVDRAFDAGKHASMTSAPMKPPHAPETPQYKAWMDGFHEHQKTLHATIGRGNTTAQ